MKQWLLKSVLFLALLYVGSLLLSLSYSVLFDQYKSDGSKKNWLLTRKGEKYDYAVLGSSRVFHMVDVLMLNRLTGKSGTNIGTSGSSYADNYALLLKYLERNSFHTLILNADEFCFHSTAGYTYPFKDYEYMPYFFQDSIRSVYHDNVPQWKYWLWTGIPLSRYIEFNEHYTLSGAIWQNWRKPFCLYDTTAGTELLYNMKYKKFSKEDTAMVHHDSLIVENRDVKYFHKILNLCRTKKIEVILITTPLYLKGKYSMENRKRFMSYLQQQVWNEKLPYINFYDLKSIQKIYYFRDLTHTNIKGTQWYTRYLGEQLNKVWNVKKNPIVP